MFYYIDLPPFSFTIRDEKQPHLGLPLRDDPRFRSLGESLADTVQDDSRKHNADAGNEPSTQLYPEADAFRLVIRTKTPLYTYIYLLARGYPSREYHKLD